MISAILAGIISYQPWTDQNGVVHPFQEYGFRYFLWNTSNIIDGYRVESLNLSTIPNVVDVGWDFEGLIAKVQNGTPLYEDVFPNINGPVYPFDKTNFQIEFQSLKSYHAEWQSNATTYATDPGNITQSIPDWRQADYFLRSQINTNITQVFREIPQSTPIDVNFTAYWHVQGIVNSTDATLPDYEYGFDTSASVSMVVRNGTMLTASGTFYVQTNDRPAAQITYRQLSILNAIYFSVGLVLIASVVFLVAFRIELRKRFWFSDGNSSPSPVHC